MINDFKEAEVRKLLIKYPNLRIALKAGLVSRRLCKDMLCITKGEMDDLYVDLIRYAAIRVLSSSAFRATDDMKNLISQVELEANDH